MSTPINKCVNHSLVDYLLTHCHEYIGWWRPHYARSLLAGMAAVPQPQPHGTCHTAHGTWHMALACNSHARATASPGSQLGGGSLLSLLSLMVFRHE